MDDFEKRNVAVVGCSVDSHFSHWAWLNTEKNDGGIKGVKYPLVSDLSKTISENYDVLAGSYDFNEDGEGEFDGEPVAYRGLFLIDKQGVVRHQVVNDLPLGRSIDEAIRMVDALQFFEDHGEVCPANWKPGDDAMVADAAGVAKYLSEH
jgi:peroxiredoxin (alkyl hydroperoxide reductase subunit C)